MAGYQIILERFRANGYRHYCNGMKYLEKRMFSHARGSFAKAQKNYDAADKLLPVAPDWFLNALANQVAESILNG